MKDSFGDRFIPTRSKAVWHINFEVTPVGCLSFFLAVLFRLHNCVVISFNYCIVHWVCYIEVPVVVFIFRTSHSQEVRWQQIREILTTLIKMELHMLACWRMNCWVLVLRTWKNNKTTLLIHSVQRYCQKKQGICFRLLLNLLQQFSMAWFYTCDNNNDEYKIW